MTDEMFQKIYKETRIGFWLLLCIVIVGSLLEDKIAVLLGIIMFLTMSFVYILVKIWKNPEVIV